MISTQPPPPHLHNKFNKTICSLVISWRDKASEETDMTFWPPTNIFMLCTLCKKTDFLTPEKWLYLKSWTSIQTVVTLKIYDFWQLKDKTIMHGKPPETYKCNKTSRAAYAKDVTSYWHTHYKHKWSRRSWQLTTHLTTLMVAVSNRTVNLLFKLVCSNFLIILYKHKNVNHMSECLNFVLL
jgi:hypothetical protein